MWRGRVWRRKRRGSSALSSRVLTEMCVRSVGMGTGHGKGSVSMETGQFGDGTLGAYLNKDNKKLASVMVLSPERHSNFPSLTKIRIPVELADEVRVLVPALPLPLYQAVKSLSVRFGSASFAGLYS